MNIKKIITSAAVLSLMAFSAAPAVQELAPAIQPTAITASAAMTFDQFFNTYNGTGVEVDYDGSYQCVELASKFMTEVLGISNNTLYGKQYWEDFYSTAFLSNNFIRCENTPSFVPKKGDIMVWKPTADNGYCGHVAVCTGEGNTSYFMSYDQNWPYGSKVHLENHNYNDVYGVIRYKGTVPGGGGNGGGTVTPPVNKGAEFGTLWVDNDIYIFNKNQTMYSDLACKKSVGTIYSGQQKRFVSFSKSGNDTIGRTSDGYFIKVKASNTLNVNAYGTVNTNSLPVKKSASSSSATVKTVYYGANFQFTKTSGDWAYAPNAGGWLDLNYIRG